MKSICLSAVLSIVALTGICAAAEVPQGATAEVGVAGNEAAAAKIAQGDTLCKEMLIRMNRKLNTDSIYLVINKIERWPDKAMSPEYIEYRNANKPMLLKYPDYNGETIKFISYFINSINSADIKKQSSEKRFKEYIEHAFKELTKTGKYEKTTYTYGPVFYNRNNAPSLPYINSRLEKMGRIIRNYNIANPSKTVEELIILREEFTPIPSKADIEKQKKDEEMIGTPDINTFVSVSSAPNLDSMPEGSEIEVIKDTISDIEDILNTLDEWVQEGYPSDLIFKLRKTTRDELEKANEKLSRKQEETSNN